MVAGSHKQANDPAKHGAVCEHVNARYGNTSVHRTRPRLLNLSFAVLLCDWLDAPLISVQPWSPSNGYRG